MGLRSSNFNLRASLCKTHLAYILPRLLINAYFEKIHIYLKLVQI